MNGWIIRIICFAIGLYAVTLVFDLGNSWAFFWGYWISRMAMGMSKAIEEID